MTSHREGPCWQVTADLPCCVHAHAHQHARFLLRARTTCLPFLRRRTKIMGTAHDQSILSNILISKQNAYKPWLGSHHPGRSPCQSARRVLARILGTEYSLAVGTCRRSRWSTSQPLDRGLADARGIRKAPNAAFGVAGDGHACIPLLTPLLCVGFVDASVVALKRAVVSFTH